MKEQAEILDYFPPMVEVTEVVPEQGYASSLTDWGTIDL